MPTVPGVTADFIIEVDGAALADAVESTLLRCEIEATYNRPDQCVLSFNVLPNGEPPAVLELGKTNKVSVMSRSGSAKELLFDGDITAVELEYVEGYSVFLVQCQDRLHRLFRGNKSRVFKDSKAADVFGTLVSEAGLSSFSEATTTSHKYLLQEDETDGDFIERLANEVNYYFRGEGNRVLFKKIGGGPSTNVYLSLGAELISFSARATTQTHLKSATVRGWDPVTKKALVGTASSGAARLDTKVVSAANGMNGVGTALLVGEGPKGHLDDVAKSVMERSIDPNLQAEGVCFGQAKLKVDGVVDVAKVGKRFSGKYRISRLRHSYSSEEGFRTEFSCRGGTDQSLAALVGHAAATERAAKSAGTFDGCAIGIVTDNNDKEGNMGRVKVKFPHVSDELESHWYRVVSPGGGGKEPHGWYLLPEVNDEVLVVFERSDPRLGYVVGGLFNGVDKPPIPLATAVENGKVNQHALYTKKGAFLLFDDKEGKEAIQMKSKSGDFDLRFEESAGLTITNKQSGNVIKVTADGNITIESKQGDVEVKASAGKLTLKAQQDVSIESAGGKVAIKAAMDASVEGLNVKVAGQANAEVKGGAMAKLEGGANATVKGAIVMIN